MALRLPELIVIFVVALLIFGPKKLPQMGAQLGRSLNAFKKGMREFNRDPMDDPFDSDGFMARHREITALQARRLELEILERELAVKRAEAALKATQENGIPPYALETTIEKDYVDEDYVEAEAIVDADAITPEEIAHAPAKPVETTEPGKEAHVTPNVSVPVEPGKETGASPDVVVPAELGKEAGASPSV